MNILYLTQFFSSTRGGGSLTFYDLARTMSKRGHKVHIICNLSTEIMDGDKNIVMHIVKPHLRESNQLPPSIIQNLRYIINSIIHGVRITRESKIDIIHTNTFTPIISGSILGYLTGRPVLPSVLDVITGHELIAWSRWAEFNKLPSYYAFIGKILEKISLMMPVSMYHANSNTTMQDILAVKPRARIRVVYPGIASTYSPYDQRQYCNFILFIGRLVYYKNLDVLIKAFEHVIKIAPNAKLIVVGDGPMKETWKEIASNIGVSRSISFVGNIATSEKIELLKKCSALALPSIFEGFGLVLLEAFAEAKPVLVSNVKPFDEIVDDGIDGFILPKDDPIAWSQKIQYLLLNRAICKKMGESGLPKAKEKFSFNKSMDRMELLYNEVLNYHENHGRRD
jgi:glycosyltransferase involved in cell wall biosynthesis